jgi:hypothetical protein
MATIAALRLSPQIISRPADKKMGLCIVNRDWYVDTCLKHLQSSRDFILIPAEDVAAAVTVTAARLSRLLEEFKAWIGHPYINVERDRLNSHLKYLNAQSPNSRIPAFYGLIKVHKSPVALRPIVACHSWITTPLSRICAYELHKLIQIHLPHVLRDSTHLIKIMEASPIPSRFPAFSTRLITGDVEGLYVNIPINEAVEKVTDFCRKHKGVHFALMINSWLKFVFEEALVAFGNKTFRQIWGFPMGTALLPDAANTFIVTNVTDTIFWAYGFSPDFWRNS